MIASLLAYGVLAVAIVFLSMKLSDYVDLLDKTTDISGAFLGGVMLAAVTSLPELLTTISSVLFVKQPDLVMGNILGSNLFNLSVLGFLMVFGLKRFSAGKISVSHRHTVLSICLITALLILSLFAPIDFDILTISVISVVIMVVYLLSVKSMSGAESDGPEEEADTNLTPKQLFTRFGICSVLLIVTSILITYTTDALAEALNLGRTFVSALLLATATSLPELVSATSLLRKNNINAMVGDIVGSNLFNFTILVVADIFMLHQSIYAMNSQALSLLFFGTISTVAITATILTKCSKNTTVSKAKTALYCVCGVVCASGYLLFLAFTK